MTEQITSGSALDLPNTEEHATLRETIEKNLAISYESYLRYVDQNADNIFRAFIQPYLEENKIGFYVCNGDWWFEDLKNSDPLLHNRKIDEDTLPENITKWLNIPVWTACSSDCLGCFMPSWDGVDYT